MSSTSAFIDINFTKLSPDDLNQLLIRGGYLGADITSCLYRTKNKHGEFIYNATSTSSGERLVFVSIDASTGLVNADF
jgi:hypothetical protein